MCLLHPRLNVPNLPYHKINLGLLVKVSRFHTELLSEPRLFTQFFLSVTSENTGFLSCFAFRDFKCLKLEVILFCSNMPKEYNTIE